MLEILLLVFLWRKLGEKLRNKGRTPIGYQIGMVLAWFGTEVVAGVIYGVVSVIANEGREPEIGIGVYATALIAAGISAGCFFLLAHILPDLNQTAHRPSSGARLDRQMPASKLNSDNPYESPLT